MIENECPNCGKFKEEYQWECVECWKSQFDVVLTQEQKDHLEEVIDNHPEMWFNVSDETDWNDINDKLSSELETLLGGLEMYPDSDGDWVVSIPYIDNDGDYDIVRLYLPIRWFYVLSAKCKCSKQIWVEEYVYPPKSEIVYCRNCGFQRWQEGIYKTETLQSYEDIEELIEEGYEVIEPENLNNIYWGIFL